MTIQPTFPTRTVMERGKTNIIPFRRPKRTDAHRYRRGSRQKLESLWREAGRGFLFAVFHGATRAELRQLSGKLFAAKEAMQRAQMKRVTHADSAFRESR